MERNPLPTSSRYRPLSPAGSGPAGVGRTESAPPPAAPDPSSSQAADVTRFDETRRLRLASMRLANVPELTTNAWLRFDGIAAALARTRPNTVLEVGCGQGSLGSWLGRDVALKL